ncbi:MAG: hypothetical protein ACXACY_21805 [Candidatus Hodarchaeales archaeon]|jgi:hypothetical protein
MKCANIVYGFLTAVNFFIIAIWIALSGGFISALIMGLVLIFSVLVASAVAITQSCNKGISKLWL